MKYCKCKIQDAPTYKKIKGFFYFVCHNCGKIRKGLITRDYFSVPDNYADWDIGSGDFTIEFMIIHNDDGSIKEIIDV